MTLITMISTATPKVTPSTEISVITETKVLLGRKYLTASSSSNGSRDMCRKLNGPLHGVNGCKSAHSAREFPLVIDGNLFGTIQQFGRSYLPAGPANPNAVRAPWGCDDGHGAVL